MKNVRYVRFALENCEEAVINIKDIQNLHLSEIVEYLNYMDNDVQKVWITHKLCNDFEIVLKKSSDKNGLWKRLTTWPDICYVDLLDKDGNELGSYLVYWEEDSCGCNNTKQIWSKEDNQLTIKIKKGA